MSKRAELPQSRRHVFIFDEDWDFLDSRYGIYSDSRMGAGVAVKKIVQVHVRRLRAREQEQIDQADQVHQQDQDQEQAHQQDQEQAQ